jgi:hypothetical protein
MKVWNTNFNSGEIIMRRLTMPSISLAVLLLLSSVAHAQACTGPGSIISVTNSSSGLYEYIVFKLQKPLNSGYSYSVATVSGPFWEQPSDNPVTITGPKHKRIRFKGITWMCTIAENFTLPKTAIKAIKGIEQHEGTVAYVVGYRNASTYISTTTSNSGSIRKVVMKFKK